jgi:hypothetical protein
MNHTMTTTLPTPDTLSLDADSLRPDELSMPALMRELNLQKKPSWLLVKLMNALEQKRQRKGLGWSRAWNKYGLTVFRTHTQRVAEDADYIVPVAATVNHFLGDAESVYRDFVADLLNDPSRMAFTFYHNNSTEDGRQYEGLTVSIGRKVPGDLTKRDRLDLILEDQRVGGAVDGRVDRLRLYVCPWGTYGLDRRFHLCERNAFTPEELGVVQATYQQCVRHYNQWKTEESRQWSHWSVRYIDYFGPRGFIPQGSSFI